MGLACDIRHSMIKYKQHYVREDKEYKGCER